METTSESIVLNAPSINWTEFAASMTDYISDAMIAAIGIGLGIFALRLVYKLFMSFCR